MNIINWSLSLCPYNDRHATHGEAWTKLLTSQQIAAKIRAEFLVIIIFFFTVLTLILWHVWLVESVFVCFLLHELIRVYVRNKHKCLRRTQNEWRGKIFQGGSEKEIDRKPSFRFRLRVRTRYFHTRAY